MDLSGRRRRGRHRRCLVTRAARTLRACHRRVLPGAAAASAEGPVRRGRAARFVSGRGPRAGARDVRIAIVGGGIAGLAAARRLEALLPDAEIVLLEATARVGGKLVTEYADGFLIEGAADSFLSRKQRAVELCEELDLADELIGRRAENARSFVRVGRELHLLPEGLTGMIPTDLDALAESRLLSPDGRARLAAEPDVPPAPPAGDESIASFVTRRLGHEAYERLVEPLFAGIYGGDG